VERGVALEFFLDDGDQDMVLDPGADREFSTAGYFEMEVPGIGSG
jgi:hypothetical protein